MAMKQPAPLTAKRNGVGKRVAALRARCILIVAVPPARALDVFGAANHYQRSKIP